MRRLNSSYDSLENDRKTLRMSIVNNLRNLLNRMNHNHRSYREIDVLVQSYEIFLNI